MGFRFFNKNIPNYCKNCVYGKGCAGTTEILCKHRGPVGPDDSCRKYKYDPLRRVPDRPMPMEIYKSEDFSL